MMVAYDVLILDLRGAGVYAYSRDDNDTLGISKFSGYLSILHFGSLTVMLAGNDMTINSVENCPTI